MKKIVVFTFITLVFASMTYLVFDIFDTTAVTNKCASELNKQPHESRDLAKLEAEVKNFDACLNSMTWWDTIQFGLIP